MPYDLLKDINTTVKDNEAQIQYMEEAIHTMFGDEAAYTLAEATEIWDAAEDSENQLDEVERASMARAGEREWVQDAKPNKPETKLGITSDVPPAVGQWVLMPGGAGKIVEIDTRDNQVMVQNRAGTKVLKFDQLMGPKKTASGDLAWALAGMQQR